MKKGINMGVHSVHIRGAFLFNSFEARVSHVYHRRWLWVAAFASLTRCVV
jgi:hypothetical protein